MKGGRVTWLIGQGSKIEEKRRLGIGNISKRNNTLLGKWLWRFPLEEYSLRHMVMKSIYGLKKNKWNANCGSH